MGLRAGPPGAAVARRRRLAEHLAAAAAGAPLARRPRRRVELVLPVLDGPAPICRRPSLPPTTGRGRPRARHRTSDAAAGRLAVRATTSLERETRARHRATARTTTAPFGARVEERYEGDGRRLDGRSRRAPGRAATTVYRITLARGRRAHGGAARAPLGRRRVPRRRRVVAEELGAEPDRPRSPRAALRAHDPAPARLEPGRAQPVALGQPTA